MRTFADALDSVPMALAENSGLSPIETLASIKSRQVKEKNTRLGVDCMQTGSNGKPQDPAFEVLHPMSMLLFTVLARPRAQALCHENGRSLSTKLPFSPGLEIPPTTRLKRFIALITISQSRHRALRC